MPTLEDTQPLDMSLVLDDHQVTPDAAPQDPPEKQPRVPEPALVRGLIMAVLGLIGAVVGFQVDSQVVDAIMQIYVVAAPIALAWWIRRNVTPVQKK